MLRILCGWCGVLIGLTLGADALTGADDNKPDAGFTSLFNGKDLGGWKAKDAKDAASLEGKTETPEKRFRVNDGRLVIDDKVKGNVVLYTIKEFGKDVHLKFEFRPGAGCNNDLYFRGLKFDIKKSDVKNLKEGEWNTFEIIVAGDKAEFKCNGESLKTEKTTSGSSTLGVRAEYGPIEFRRIQFKE